MTNCEGRCLITRNLHVADSSVIFAEYRGHFNSKQYKLKEPDKEDKQDVLA